MEIDDEERARFTDWIHIGSEDQYKKGASSTVLRSEGMFTLSTRPLAFVAERLRYEFVTWDNFSVATESAFVACMFCSDEETVEALATALQCWEGIDEDSCADLPIISKTITRFQVTIHPRL